MRRSVLARGLLLSLAITVAYAQDSAQGTSVKVFVLGGSVAAFPSKGFSDQLRAVCRNIDVENLAEARLSALAIRRRFEERVLQSLKKPAKTSRETWVVVLGGLNSVGDPEGTNAELLKIFRKAHAYGMKVMGLTLTPWGDESDPRWKGFDGVRRLENTRKVSDFILGRLSPTVALGRHAKGMKEFSSTDLPDIAVDLYDSELRERNAPMRNKKDLLAEMDKHPWVQERLKAVPDQRRAEERERILRLALEVPRWFLRKDLRSFDHIHPNAEGHRIIAKEVCKKAPKSWGCDCSLLERK